MNSAITIRKRSGLGRQSWLLAITLVAVSMLATACGNNNAINSNVTAAVIDNHVIPMDQYLGITRVLYAVQFGQGATATPISWQQPKTRANLVTSQEAALNLLVTNYLYDQQAQKLDEQHLLTPTLKAIKTQEDARVKSLLGSQSAQIQPLIDSHVLTPQTLRPILHQSYISTALFTTVTVPVAHIKIFTAASQTKALSARQQLLAGGDWATLATTSSIDGAQTTGGDVSGLAKGVFSQAIDDAIFNGKPDPKAISQPIANGTGGWSIVQVLDLSQAKIAALDDTIPVLATARISQKQAGINAYQATLLAAKNLDVAVNWCNSLNGTACPSILSLSK